MRPQGAIEDVQHEPGLHGDPAPLDVEIEDAIEVLAEVDDEGCPDRLPALRGPASTWQEWRAGLRGERDDTGDVLLGARDRHAEGIDLVDRGVRRVAPATGPVEENLALDLAGETLRERPVVTAPLVSGCVLMVGHGGCSETSGCRSGRPAVDDVVRGAGRRSPAATDHTGCFGRIRPVSRVRAAARRRGGNEARGGPRPRCTRFRPRRRDRARRTPGAPRATRRTEPSCPRTRP